MLPFPRAACTGHLAAQGKQADEIGLDDPVELLVRDSSADFFALIPALFTRISSAMPSFSIPAMKSTMTSAGKDRRRGTTRSSPAFRTPAAGHLRDDPQ